MINQLLSYSIISLVFTTLLLGLVLGFVVISYRKVLEKLFNLQKKEIEEKEKLNIEARKILDEARAKAEKILSDVDFFKTQESKKLSETLAKFSQEQIQSAISDIRQTVIAEVSSSKDSFKESLFASYKNEFEAARKQIEEYKKSTMEDIDTRARQILNDLAMSVLGKRISTEDHEDLIIKALDEAKKKNAI